MIEDSVRVALKNDIAARMMAPGPKRWAEIQNRYPQVSASTFWRIVSQIKRAHPIQDYGQAPSTHDSSNEKLQGPNLVARFTDGEADFPVGAIIPEVAQLFVDANLLRRYALDSEGNIKNPVAFATSIKMRERAISTAVYFLPDVYNASYQEAYLSGLVDVLIEGNHDVAVQVMQKLRKYVHGPNPPTAEIQRSVVLRPEPLAAIADRAGGASRESGS